ncbi:hypothetical protein TNIN_46591 [Trichonephila inaurata madagascariensis]|uniref:Uncharacterized protein n=1 Tax=Trichonephila inaurata madagascariensis TaxID=2747483 RepID=A0A8X6YMS9_9ARAC|nr:hypothetical protein TNIN_46591 [Trichonephila inaurata madagascariensis]
MFSECHVSLNDCQISSENNYASKAFIQSILFHSKGSQNNLLSIVSFEKDIPGEFDDASALCRDRRHHTFTVFDNVAVLFTGVKNTGTNWCLMLVLTGVKHWCIL